MIDEGHEGVVIPEPALEPEVSAYRLIGDCYPAAFVTAPAESVGGCLSYRIGEGVQHGGSACRSSITASETARDKLPSVLLAGAVFAKTNSDSRPTTILRDEFETRRLKSIPDSGLIRDRDAKGTFLHFRSAHSGDADASGVGNLLGGPPEDSAGGAKLLTCDCQIIT